MQHTPLNDPISLDQFLGSCEQFLAICTLRFYQCYKCCEGHHEFSGVRLDVCNKQGKSKYVWFMPTRQIDWSSPNNVELTYKI